MNNSLICIGISVALTALQPYAAGAQGTVSPAPLGDSTEIFLKGDIQQELIYRTTFGRADDIRILLKKGADANTRNEQGWPVLAIAADRTDDEALKLVQAFIEGGANPNLADDTKNYPIINAIRNGQTEIVAYLLQSGADFHIKDSRNRALIDVAHSTNHKQIIALIQKAIDDEQARFAHERSPERLRLLSEEYALSNCAYQYYSYYKLSGQDPLKAALIQQEIDKYRENIASTSGQMVALFPWVKTEYYKHLSEPPIKAIFKELDEMISNRNRRAKGVGTEQDMNRRCGKLVKALNITIPQNIPITVLPTPK